MGLNELLMMFGTDRSKRAEDDFYETPEDATEDLLKREKFSGLIWEPSCGAGAISRVLERNGLDVISSDLIDRGYGSTGIDFLSVTRQPDHIVGNPPYLLARQFIERSLEVTKPRKGKVALLLRLLFLEGTTRREMFQTTPLSRVYVFSRRLGFTKNGKKHEGGFVAYAWYIWDWNRTSDHPELHWI